MSDSESDDQSFIMKPFGGSTAPREQKVEKAPEPETSSLVEESSSDESSDDEVTGSETIVSSVPVTSSDALASIWKENDAVIWECISRSIAESAAVSRVLGAQHPQVLRLQSYRRLLNNIAETHAAFLNGGASPLIEAAAQAAQAATAPSKDLGQKRPATPAAPEAAKKVVLATATGKVAAPAVTPVPKAKASPKAAPAAPKAKTQPNQPNKQAKPNQQSKVAAPKANPKAQNNKPAAPGGSKPANNNPQQNKQQTPAVKANPKATPKANPKAAAKANPKAAAKANPKAAAKAVPKANPKAAPKPTPATEAPQAKAITLPAEGTPENPETAAPIAQVDMNADSPAVGSAKKRGRPKKAAASTSTAAEVTETEAAPFVSLMGGNTDSPANRAARRSASFGNPTTPKPATPKVNITATGNEQILEFDENAPVAKRARGSRGGKKQKEAKEQQEEFIASLQAAAADAVVQASA